MNNNERDWRAIYGFIGFCIGMTLGFFLFRNVYTPSYPDRTQEVVDLEAAVSNFGIMLDKACKFKNQGNGDWTYYSEATSTPPLVCDAPLATSTATSTN